MLAASMPQPAPPSEQLCSHCHAAQAEKMFLVEVKPLDEDPDCLLNLECIFELSHKSRDVRRGAVHKSASIDENTDPYETTLRITWAALPLSWNKPWAGSSPRGEEVRTGRWPEWVLLAGFGLLSTEAEPLPGLANEVWADLDAVDLMCTLAWTWNHASPALCLAGALRLYAVLAGGRASTCSCWTRCPRLMRLWAQRRARVSLSPFHPIRPCSQSRRMWRQDCALQEH